MPETRLAPWDDESAVHYLSTVDSWYNLCRLIQTTLKQDPQKYPHQIRAACAVVIMVGRENVWPAKRAGIWPLLELSSIARRQLSNVKRHFSSKARINPEMKTNPKFRKLMDSVDQEIRILENRISDEPSQLPEQPPSSWGQFWCD